MNWSLFLQFLDLGLLVLGGILGYLFLYPKGYYAKKAEIQARKDHESALIEKLRPLERKIDELSEKNMDRFNRFRDSLVEFSDQVIVATDKTMYQMYVLADHLQNTAYLNNHLELFNNSRRDFEKSYHRILSYSSPKDEFWLSQIKSYYDTINSRCRMITAKIDLMIILSHNYNNTIEPDRRKKIESDILTEWTSICMIAEDKKTYRTLKDELLALIAEKLKEHYV